VEYVLGKTKPISCNLRYYFDFYNENKWFVPKESQKYGHVINLKDSKHIEDKLKEFLTLPKNDNKIHTYFYHCTNWRSAKNIIEHGVNSSKGRMCLDFGIRQGFYTTQNINTAIEWGEKRINSWYGQVAILIFEIKANKLKKYKTKYFYSAADEWKRLVSHSRKCEENENELDFADFVYGPICVNPKNVKYNGTPPIAQQDKFQFVSKSIDADILMRKSYVGCIYFENKKNNLSIN
jgi:hypothetical protein